MYDLPESTDDCHERNCAMCSYCMHGSIVNGVCSEYEMFDAIEKVNEVKRMTQISNKDALAFLSKNNYLIINSKRQTGKTQMLQFIIEHYPCLNIIVRCPTKKVFDMNYKRYRNCIYEAHGNNNGDLIIGDEVYVTPSNRRMSACALTNVYEVYSVKSPIEIHDYLEVYPNEIVFKVSV